MRRIPAKTSGFAVRASRASFFHADPRQFLKFASRREQSIRLNPGVVGIIRVLYGYEIR
jgi:hypothetical protein